MIGKWSVGDLAIADDYDASVVGFDPTCPKTDLHDLTVFSANFDRVIDA